MARRTQEAHVAIHDVKNYDDGDTVHCFGDPTDVEPLLKRMGVEAVFIAGYDVTDVADAQHDGMPARRFTLSAEREVGRLVIQTGVPTEYTFEFDVQFIDDHAAEDFVDEIKNPTPIAQAKVVQSIQDFAWEGTHSLAEALAEVSAEHGVSITVTQERGPGGGWPVVKIQGLAPNVRNVLHDNWSYDDEDIDSQLEAVTV